MCVRACVRMCMCVHTCVSGGGGKPSVVMIFLKAEENKRSNETGLWVQTGRLVSQRRADRHSQLSGVPQTHRARCLLFSDRADTVLTAPAADPRSEVLPAGPRTRPFARGCTAPYGGSFAS